MTDSTPAPPARLLPAVGGGLALAVAVGSSLMLTATHFDAMDLPGCSVESACGRAQSSAWGSVPGVGWPVSHVGLAWFVALFVAWLLAVPKRAVGALRWPLRVSAVASVVFLAAMVVGGYLCPYCIAVHGGGLLALAAAEWAGRPANAARTRRPLVVTAVVAVAGLGVLLLADASAEQRAEQRAEQEGEESVQRILEAGDDERVAFRGRFVKGASPAAIRLVVFSDFQCPDCNRVEDEIRELMATHGDLIALSHKQFPLDSACNRAVNRPMHPNACAAARASEAAGLLYGEDGFWRMHEWLFDVDGTFDRARLVEGLEGLGFDPQRVIEVMTGEEALELVQEDIEEGLALGLSQTPTVYVNGVEFKGTRIAGGLTRRIAEIAAANPEPRTFAEAGDDPLTGEEKIVADWLAVPRRPVDVGDPSRTLGPADATLNVVAWIDYRSPAAARVDAAIRDRMERQGGIRYTAMHFPVDQACNSVPRNLYPGSCRSASLVEAAAILGGPDARWTAHAWLFEHQRPLDEAAIDAVAAATGLDGATLRRTMFDPAVARAIASDIAAAGPIRGIPTLVIDDRRVPKFSLDNEVRLDLIFDEVLGPVTP